MFHRQRGRTCFLFGTLIIIQGPTGLDFSRTDTSPKHIWVVTHQSRVKFHKAHSLSYLHPRYLKGNFSFLPHCTQHHCPKHQPHLQQHGMLIPSKKTAWRVLEITRHKSRAAFPQAPCSNLQGSETQGWKGKGYGRCHEHQSNTALKDQRRCAHPQPILKNLLCWPETNTAARENLHVWQLKFQLAEEMGPGRSN